METGAFLDSRFFLLVLIGFVYIQECKSNDINIEHVLVPTQRPIPQMWTESNETHNNDADNSTNSLRYHIFSLAGETIKECDSRMLCVDRCSIKLKNMSETSPGFSSDVPSSFSSTSSPTMKLFRKKRHTNNNHFNERKNDTAPRLYLSNEKDSVHNYGKGDTNNDSDFQGFRSRRNVGSERSMCMPPDPTKDLLCYCDEDCFIYGDCCADVFESCLGLVEPDDISSFLSEHVESFNTFLTTDDLSQALKDEELDTDLIVGRYLSEYGTCIELNHFTGMGTMLIDTCPHNFTGKGLQMKCHEPDSPLLPPVTANVNGNFLPFKNIFCAQCHNIVDSIIPWKPVLACSEDFGTQNDKPLNVNDIIALIKDNICNVTFKPPTEGMCSLRYCLQPHLSSLEKKQVLQMNEEIGLCTSFEASLCRVYFRPMGGHKNLHCKACLEDTMGAKQTEGLSSAWDCIIDLGHRVPFDPKPGGIVIILDIDGNFLHKKDEHSVKNYICAETEVFDPFTQVCRRLVCQRGYETFKGECIKTTDAYLVDGSTQIFPDAWDMMYVSFSIGESDLNKLSCRFLGSVIPYYWFTQDIKMSKILKFTNKREEQCPNGTADSYDSNDETEIPCQENVTCTDRKMEFKEHFEIHLNIFSNSSHDIIDQMNTLAGQIANWVGDIEHSAITLTNINAFTGTKLNCPKELVENHWTDFSVRVYEAVLYAVPMSTDVEILYPLQSIGYKKRVDIVGKLVSINDTIIVCEENRLFSRTNCIIIAYRLNGTLQNGLQIVILETQQVYQPGDYAIINDTVFVCRNFTSKLSQRFRKDTIYHVISWVFTILSIIFLLIMLIVYAMIPELCNLPGKLTASLAATMMLTFVANLFTLVDLHNDYICPVAAALTHLVTLAYYGWMAAISVNMAITFGFRSMIITNSLNESKTFLRYNMVVWGLSAAIVLTSVILDATHHEPSNSISGPANNTEDLQKSSPPYEVLQKSEDASGFPRYGYLYCTWFSGDMWTRLAFVIVPFFITYIISVTGFVITLVGIQRASKATAKLGKQSSARTRCLIYFKLSTAMGFSWILSLVLVAFPKVSALQYCYVILVLLQGVLLFLAFMVNKRVYGMFHKKFTFHKGRSSNTVTGTGVKMSNNL